MAPSLQWKNDYKAFVSAYRDASEKVAARIADDHGEFTYPLGGVRPVRLPRCRPEPGAADSEGAQAADERPSPGGAETPAPPPGGASPPAHAA